MKGSFATGYSDDWAEIAAIVKEKANWHCVNCQHGHDPASGHTLTVHHIDRNKANNSPQNLVALCQRCHLHYQRTIYLYQLPLFDKLPWLKAFHQALRSKSRPP